MTSPTSGDQTPDDLTPPAAHDPYGGLAEAAQQAAQQAGRGWMRSPKTWIIAAVALVVVVVGGVVGASALSGGGSSATSTASRAPANGVGGPGRRGTVGTLQSIDGSTLTVATFNRGGGQNGAAAGGGTTTVITKGSTKFYKTVSGSVSDIKTGDRVTATGTPDGTTALTAARITDAGTMTAGFGPGGGGGGRRFRNGGAGTNGTNGSAQSNPNFTRPDPNSFAAGTVKSISGSTLTVTQPDGTTKTVNTTGSTAVMVLKSVSINDLTTGQAIIVGGTMNSDGTVTANNVVQGVGGFGGGFRGRFGGGGADNGGDNNSQPGNPGNGTTTQ